jgi:hypothetical protein
MKTLLKKNHVSIVFGEWFDRYNGNTYYDALVRIDDHSHEIPYCYGYNAGDKQSIDEALAACGYKVRANPGDVHAPYRAIHTSTTNKLKRELYKNQDGQRV